MGTRGRILTVPVGERLVTETCYSCGVLFAMAEDFYDARQRDRQTFHCPAGHGQVYAGKTDTQKLREAEARETALRDQLEASIREADSTRIELLRIQSRIANGVCPCCNRSFDNVRRHIADQHPTFRPPRGAAPKRYRCSCNRSFETFRGLRTHQGHERRTTGAYRWDKQGQDSFWSHLTAVGT